jgi:hypothetical protein
MIDKLTDKIVNDIENLFSSIKEKEKEISVLETHLHIYAKEFYNNFWEFVKPVFVKYKDLDSFGILFSNGIDMYNFSINGKDYDYLSPEVKFFEEIIFEKLPNWFWSKIDLPDWTWNVFYRDGRRTETRCLPVEGTKEDEFQELKFSEKEEIIRKARWRDEQIDNILNE